MYRPLVSVITSNYNGAEYLADCISSVLNQTFDSWEHIIIDCGSEDNSRQVLKSLKHPRLKVIEEEFCGVARGRNLAIQHAQGEFCAILDVDDMALPDRLRLQIDLLSKDQKIAGVGGNVEAIYDTDPGHKTVLYFPSQRQEIELLLQSTLSPILHSTLTFRKKIFQEISGYSEEMPKAEDFDLILRLALHGGLKNVDRTVGVQRFRSSGSLTTRKLHDGRDDHYYSVLSILFNSAYVNGIDCTQRDIEEWLSGLDNQEVKALRGRWIWENLKNEECRSFEIWKILLATFLHFNPAMIMTLECPWWPEASNPENIIKECVEVGHDLDKNKVKARAGHKTNANYFMKIFELPLDFALCIEECRKPFFILPLVLRSAGRIAGRFHISRLKVLMCKEFLEAWLVLAWKKDTASALLLMPLKVLSPKRKLMR